MTLYTPTKDISANAFSNTLFEKLQRQRHGLCQHCGGKFQGVVKKTCTRCGKPKDY